MRKAIGASLLLIILIPIFTIIDGNTSLASTTYGTHTTAPNTISVNGLYDHKEIERTTKEITITINNTDITAGTVLAPHLYDWYFNGVDGYIYTELPITFKLSVNEPYGTIATAFVDYDTSRLVGALTPHTYIAGLGKTTSALFSLAIDVLSPTQVQGYFRGLGHFGYVGVGEVEGRWFEEVFGYHVIDANNTQVFMWINGQPQTLGNNGLYSYTDNRFGTDINANILRIGWSGINEPDERLKGKVSFVIIWHNKLLSDNEVLDLYSNHTLTSQDLAVFMDPTFFNGTDYLDLINSSVIGVPYGGVERVPANVTWVWVVEGAYQDAYVHLEWFPVGSSVLFYNASNNVLVKKVVITSNDMTVSLPNGKYNIVVHTYLTTISIHIINGFIVNGTKIEITNSGSQLDNYPLRLEFTATNFTQWSEVSASNIYFTDANGNPLYYYVEKVDTVNKDLVVWVNVTLPVGTTTIYMHYGGTNPYSTYNDPWKVFTVYEDWSESVTNAGTGPTNYALITHWNNTITDSSTDAQWNVTINTTMAYLYVKDGTAGDGEDDNYLFSQEVVRIPCIAYVTVNPPAYTLSSSFSIGFGVKGGSTPFTQAVFAKWIPGVRIVTNNGTVSTYNQYSYYPPYGTFTELKLLLTQTHLFLYYYNTTLGQWVYVGNVTLNFDPTLYDLKFYVKVAAWSTSSQSLYVKPVTMVYYAPNTSLTFSHIDGEPLQVIYPNYLEVAQVRVFNSTTDTVITPSVTAYNSTHNTFTLTSLGVSDVDIYLDTYFNPILYLNSYNNYTYFPYGYNVSITGAVVNQSVSPVSGIPVDYTVAEVNPHKVITSNLTIGTKITTEATITAGTVLAPHLYDWYMNGLEKSFVKYNNPESVSTGVETFQVRVKFVSSTDTSNSLIFLPPESPRINIERTTHYVFVWYDNATSTGFLVTKPWIDYLDNKWHYFTVSNNGSIIHAWYDGVLKAIWNSASHGPPKLYSYVAVGPTNSITIATAFTEIISYAIVMKTPIYSPLGEIPNIVNKTQLLLDPTFYNGSTYFDISNTSIIGIPYGNIQRIPADTAWVWVVEGVYDDGYVHFRFFPNGTVIKVFDDNGNLVREFTIEGTPNGAGLIDDFKIMLPNGNYKIIAYIPSGNILAPHLYDWYFDGTGHIKLPLLDQFFSPSATVEVYMKPDGKTGTIEDVFRAQKMWVAGWTAGIFYPQFRVYLYFNASWHYITLNPPSGWYSLGLAYITGANGVFAGYLNGQQVGNITGYLNVTANPEIYVDIGSENGVYYYKGWISYLKYYTEFQPGIFMKRVMNIGEGRLLLFDPTFFNGTDYFDLLNSSIVGVPYGGVSRVPANMTWIWNVLLYEYGKPVQLRWFPKGSLVQFVDPNTGEVVKQVIVTSDSDTVDVPAGTYTVRVYVGMYCAEGSLATDASGQVSIYLTTPSNDSLIYVQLVSDGYYMGLQTLEIVSTGIKYNVTVPDMVTRNTPFNYTVEAYLTATDIAPVTMTINGTVFYTNIKTLSYTYNESGHHTFTLLLSGTRDAVTVSYTFTKTLFVGGHVNWVLTLSPNIVPYPLNYTFTATLDVKYDNGEELTVPVSVNVTRLDTKVLIFTNTSKPAITMNLTAVWDLRVDARLTDLDGKVYTFGQIIYAAIPHQSFSIIIKGTGYVFRLNTTIKHVFLSYEPDKYNQTIIFYDFYNFTINVYRDYILVLSQNATNPMYFNIPEGYEADVYFDMIGKKIVLYVYLPGAVRPGSITVVNVNPLMTSAPNIALPAPTNNLFSEYGIVGSLLSTAMILGVGIGFAKAERDPIIGVAIASAIMVPVALLIGNQTAYYISLAILVISIGYKVMRWLTS